MSDIKQIHAYVSGKVQGVGYRYFVEKCAHRLGLKGEVRNLGDGRVEVIAEGNTLILRPVKRARRQGWRCLPPGQAAHAR